MSTNAPKEVSGLTLPAVVSPAPPPKQGEAPCRKCKELRQRIEDLEGALDGAHALVRTLRDAASTVKEKA